MHLEKIQEMFNRGKYAGIIKANCPKIYKWRHI